MLAKFMILLALLSYSCKPHQTESQEEAFLIARNQRNESKTTLFFFDTKAKDLVIRFCSENDSKQCFDKNSNWKGGIKKLNIEGADSHLNDYPESLREHYRYNKVRYQEMLSDDVAQLLFLNSQRNSLEKAEYWFWNQGTKLKPIEQEVISALFNITLYKGVRCESKSCL